MLSGELKNLLGGGGEFKITLERGKLQKLKDENLPERPYEKNVKANFQNFYLHSKYFYVPLFYDLYDKHELFKNHYRSHENTL